MDVYGDHGKSACKVDFTQVNSQQLSHALSHMFLNANSHFLEVTKARIIFPSFLQIQLRIVRIALETNLMLSDITKT